MKKSWDLPTYLSLLIFLTHNSNTTAIYETAEGMAGGRSAGEVSIGGSGRGLYQDNISLTGQNDSVY